MMYYIIPDSVCRSFIQSTANTMLLAFVVSSLKQEFKNCDQAKLISILLSNLNLFESAPLKPAHVLLIMFITNVVFRKKLLLSNNE